MNRACGRVWQRFLDASIRTKYILSALLLLVMLIACGTYVCVTGYNIAYREYITTAENDFTQVYSALSRFEKRMQHLATLFQQNEQANALLVSIPEMASGEHVRARTTLLQILYIMLDGSGDYDCMLYVNPALQIAGDSSRIQSLAAVESTAWAQEALSGWGWRRFYDAEALGADEPALIVPIRDSADYLHLIAILRIDLQKAALERMLGAIKSEEFTSCYIETTDGQLVAFTGIADESLPVQYLHENPVRGFAALQMNSVSLQGGMVYYQTLPASGWRLVLAVHRDLHLKGTLPEYLLLAGIGVLLAFVGFLLGVPILLPVTNRLHRFHQHMLGIRRDGIHRYPESHANDEVGQLIHAHNEMLAHIEALMAEKEQTEQEMRRLEISALQSQIKPHFLYNTLEAVSWMTRKNQPERIQSTLRSLTGFYRMCLSHGKDVLPVAQELEIVRNYFNVQSIRYEQEFRLDIEADDETLRRQLPKITLQPLVENALLHGILESGRSEGVIRIYNRRSQDGHAELCVADSGAHFTQADFAQALADGSETGEGYGLHNVERRLELYFKADRVLYLDPADPGWSTVVLRFF